MQFIYKIHVLLSLTWLKIFIRWILGDRSSFQCIISLNGGYSESFFLFQMFISLTRVFGSFEVCTLVQKFAFILKVISPQVFSAKLPLYLSVKNIVWNIRPLLRTIAALTLADRLRCYRTSGGWMARKLWPKHTRDFTSCNKRNAWCMIYA